MSKYVALDRLRVAIERLPLYPPAVTSFLGMKRAGVNYTNKLKYGATEENPFLNLYFAPAGAPRDKKFYIPFSKDGWVVPDYSGKTLQRARGNPNPNGKIFANGLIKDGDKFQFRADVIPKLLAPVAKGDDGKLLKVNVYDVICWLRRNDEFADIATPSTLLAAFKAEFHFTDDEVGQLFYVPSDAEESSLFSATKINDDSLIGVLGGVRAGVKLEKSEEELMKFLEDFIKTEANFISSAGFVKRFYNALKAQNFVVLTGKPGTGKTQFVGTFVRGLMKFFQTDDVQEVFLAVSAEYSETDVIGYENLEGHHVTTEFIDKFIDSDAAKERRGLFFLVLDEFNLAHADRYLARLLPAIESDRRIILPAHRSAYLPSDTFIVGTANSYLDESTRLPLSGPVLRRAHVIEMPNVLTEQLEGTESEFADVLKALARQTSDRLTDRAEMRGESFLDQQRKVALDNFADGKLALDPKHLTALHKFCTALAADPISAMTLGVLQDAVEYLILAGLSKTALDESIVQKLLPQARGSVEYLENALPILKDAELSESTAYAERMIALADPVTRTIQALV